MSFVNKPMAK